TSPHTPFPYTTLFRSCFRVSYVIGFDHPLLRHQAASFRVAADTFAEAIAPARTFGFLREVETLRRSGLALGGSLDNAVVIGETRSEEHTSELQSRGHL